MLGNILGNMLSNLLGNMLGNMLSSILAGSRLQNFWLGRGCETFKKLGNLLTS